MLSKFLEDSMPPSLGEEIQVFAHWSKAVGSEVTKHAKPTSFRNGILFAETAHSTWNMELSNRKMVILKKLNDALGKPLVRDIHFRVGKRK